jgi:hypothetical protein
MTFSLSIDHTPWIASRRENLASMLMDLLPLANGIPYLCNDDDYHGFQWVDIKDTWALKKWRWHIAQGADHAVMLSDDVAVMPRFWDVLGAMVSSAPNSSIGLMSNHPDGPAMLAGGHHWYRCNAWLVGPAIVMPTPMLAEFVSWYEDWYPRLPRGRDAEGFQEWYHDDSSINEWINRRGPRESLHPLPAPIEHQLGLGRSHDTNPFPKYAAEAISWKREWHDNPRTFSEIDRSFADRMTQASWWHGARISPMLEVV